MKFYIKKPELVTTFEFEGVKYGLIPDFDKDITAGELIDLDKYLELKLFKVIKHFI
jgi:hypothetical protein